MSDPIVYRSGPHRTRIAVVLTITVVALAFMPFFADRFALRTMTEMACFLTLAMMWNLLAGYAGVMSIGQQLYVGIGGYTFFLIAALGGLPLYLMLAISGAVALAVALPASFALFRLNGAYFAVATWVLAEIAALGFSNADAVGGGAGMSFPIAIARDLGNSDQRSALFWWLAFGLVITAYCIAYFWLRSPRGLALMAMRDDPDAASGLGVSTSRNRLLVYSAAAFVTGIAGAIIFLTKLRISPVSAFNINEWTAAVLFIVVIGGLGSLEGPLIGLAIFFALRVLLADFGAWYLIVLGAIAIATMLIAPKGIWGILQSRYGWELFPLKRHVQINDGEQK